MMLMFVCNGAIEWWWQCTKVRMMMTIGDIHPKTG
jgi:hypothetical protein